MTRQVQRSRIVTDAASITGIVLAAMENTANPRLKEILNALVKHAHAFVRMGALRALKELRCKDTLKPALEGLSAQEAAHLLALRQQHVETTGGLGPAILEHDDLVRSSQRGAAM